MKQQNIYQVNDSMGRKTQIYITASDINEAYAKSKAPEMKAQIKSSFYKLKRIYNGGAMGQK